MLFNLPPELIQIIIDALVAPYSYERTIGELHFLSQICHFFRLHTDKRIYGNIELTWEPSEFDRPIHLLLLRVINRPEIASIIHRVKFNSWNMRMLVNDTLGIRAVYTNEELGKLKELIYKMGVGEPEVWLEKMLEGDMDAMASVLFAQLDELRELELVVDYSIERTIPVWFWKLIKHAVEVNSGAFKNLRKLKYFCKGYEAPQRAEFDSDSNVLLPLLLRLPSIRELNIGILDDKPLPSGSLDVVSAHRIQQGLPMLNQPNPTPQRLTPTLTTLKFSNYHIITLQQMLKHCPNLQTLIYNLDLNIAHPDLSFFDLDLFRECLQTVKQTLKHLSIRSYFYHEDRNVEWRDWANLPNRRCGFLGNLGPLTFLEKLESLESNLSLLMYWDGGNSSTLTSILPDSLRKLRITRDCVGCLDAASWESGASGYVYVFQHLLLSKEKLFPWLEEVELSHRYIWKYTFIFNEEQEKKIELLAKEKGVKFRISREFAWYYQDMWDEEHHVPDLVKSHWGTKGGRWGREKLVREAEERREVEERRGTEARREAEASEEARQQE